jgi:hypothetical protein
MPVLQVARRVFSTVSDAPFSASTSGQRSSHEDQEALTLDDDEEQDLPADPCDDSPVQHK